MYSDARGTADAPEHRPARAPGAAVQLPVDRRRTGASGSRRSGWRGRSSASRRWPSSMAARPRPGRRSRPTSRSSTGWRATPRPRCIRRAPPGWASTTLSVVDPTTMRVHGVDGLRVVDASAMPYVTNAQHLRAGDDAGREGRRPRQGRHAAAARSARVLPARRVGAATDRRRRVGAAARTGHRHPSTRARHPSGVTRPPASAAALTAGLDHRGTPPHHAVIAT